MYSKIKLIILILFIVPFAMPKGTFAATYVQVPVSFTSGYQFNWDSSVTFGGGSSGQPQNIKSIYKWRGAYPNRTDSYQAFPNNFDYYGNFSTFNPDCWDCFGQDVGSNGKYWIEFVTATSSPDIHYYAEFERFGYRDWLGSTVVSDNSTRIISLYPNATTTSTTTVTVGGTYFNNDSLAPVQSVTLKVTNQQPPYDSLQFNFPAYVSGSSAFSTTTELAQGDWSLLATLNFASSTKPNADTVAKSFKLAQFHVIEAVEDNYYSGGFVNETGENDIADECTATVASSTASLPSKLGCYAQQGFEKVISKLFMPSAESVNLLKTLNAEVSGKFPFAYVYDMSQMRNEIFDSPTTASTTVGVNVEGFGQITFLSKPMLEAVPYAGLVKTILGFLLWLMGIEYIYIRTLRAHDKTS